MKKMMLIGGIGCGKTFLARAMQGLPRVYHKTSAVDYFGSLIDTPGEYVENGRHYSALFATSQNCDVVALVQDVSHEKSVFPKDFAHRFNKKVIGIVSKADLPGGDLVRAGNMLKLAGVDEVVFSSSVNKTGLSTLKTYLIFGR